MAQQFTGANVNTEKEWNALYNWIKNDVPQQFSDAFTKETGISLGNAPKLDDLVCAAIPKTINDLENKVKNDAYYKANAFWFLNEIENIVNCIPYDFDEAGLSAYSNAFKAIKVAVLDSKILISDWALYKEGVPDVYGIGKNPSEHMMSFYQGARQVIYGHGTFRLSYADIHSDNAIATIRQAIELRIRRAFGVMAKISKSDQSIHPISVSDILKVVKSHQSRITTPILLDNIIRLNGWANIYLHSGLKPYVWCAPRTLNYLKPFLIGSGKNVKDGVKCSDETFDLVVDEIKSLIDPTKFELMEYKKEYCDVEIV